MYATRASAAPSRSQLMTYVTSRGPLNEPGGPGSHQYQHSYLGALGALGFQDDG